MRSGKVMELRRRGAAGRGSHGKQRPRGLITSSAARLIKPLNSANVQTRFFMERTRYYRFLEIIPGAAVWLTLSLAVILSYFQPLVVIYFIIIFDTFWLFLVVFFVL